MEGYQKVATFLKDSGLLEGKLSLSIDVRTHDPTVCIIPHTSITYFSNYRREGKFCGRKFREFALKMHFRGFNFASRCL